jgi:hypothetical protein
MSKKEIKFMKKKSIDSFLLAIEIYNKPTIDYRLEGCVFFLCNAWELMFKAKLLMDKMSIYYPSKGKKRPKRTITLNDCVEKVLTNENDPVRKNLSIIISLRNTATHFIVPEYEAKYVPFLAFNVRAYAQKLYEYFKINISDYIRSDFISLFTVNHPNQQTNILGKYGANIANMFTSKSDNLANLVDQSSSDIALNVQINLVRVNKQSLADESFYLSRNPNDPHAKTISKNIDYNLTHTLTHNKVANKIDSIIKTNNLLFTPLRQPIKTEKNRDPHLFTTACLDLILKEYNLKDNIEYCHMTKYGNTPIYKYSDKLVTYIISLISDNPNIVIEIREKRKG